MTVRRGVLALACALAGCSPEPGASGEPLVEPQRCSTMQGATPRAIRAVAIGLGEPDGFIPLEDGDEVALVLGTQGGYMITPTIRVAADDGDGDALCLMASLDNAMAAPSDIGPGVQAYLSFEMHGAYCYAANIFDLLAFDAAPLVGRALTLHALVRGDGFEGSDEVSVMLR